MNYSVKPNGLQSLFQDVKVEKPFIAEGLREAFESSNMHAQGYSRLTHLDIANALEQMERPEYEGRRMSFHTGSEGARMFNEAMQRQVNVMLDPDTATGYRPTTLIQEESGLGWTPNSRRVGGSYWNYTQSVDPIWEPARDEEARERAIAGLDPYISPSQAEREYPVDRRSLSETMASLQYMQNVELERSRQQAIAEQLTESQLIEQLDNLSNENV